MKLSWYYGLSYYQMLMLSNLIKLCLPYATFFSHFKKQECSLWLLEELDQLYLKNPLASSMPRKAPAILTTKDKAMQMGEAFLVMLSSMQAIDSEQNTEVPKPVRKRPRKTRTTPGQWLESSECRLPFTQHSKSEHNKTLVKLDLPPV